VDTIVLSKDDIFELARHLARTPVVFGPIKNVTIGENVSLMNAILNVQGGTITVGDGTFFGHHVCVLAASHPIDEPIEGDRQKHYCNGHDVVIGKNVWIATNVTILGPCTIGDNAVIAAGSVVTKDIEADWIYAGVPARKLRKVT
jgi:acetyltransferase-like isoleucine patch superfamily enzyme